MFFRHIYPLYVQHFVDNSINERADRCTGPDVYTSRTTFEYAWRGFIVPQKVNLSSAPCIRETPKLCRITSVFLTSRHYVARTFARALLNRRVFSIREIFVSGSAAVSHVGFLIPTTNLPFFRICSQSSDDCASADFREITKRARLVMIFFSYVEISPRGLLFQWKNDVYCI